MHYTDQVNFLKQELSKPLPGLDAQNSMASRMRKLPLDVPDDARQSAVLCLLFPVEEILNVLLIKRVEDGKPHSGQISFPGGGHDDTDKDLQETALRETFEEVGIPSGDIEIIGALSELYIPVSNNNVHPFVGYTAVCPTCNLSIEEVQYTLEIPIKELFHPDIKKIKEIRPSSHPELLIKTPAYEWDEDHTIWGATAMMLAELQEIWKAANLS